MKISMLEPIAVPEELLEKLAVPLMEGGHEVELCNTNLTQAEKEKRVSDADIIIVANSPLSSSIIENAAKLKMISVAFTGVDHIPKEVCNLRKITVCNAQGYATIAVRDLVFGMIFGIMRNLSACDDAVRKGGTKDGLVGNEISGKTMGIIGYGQIGRAVAEVAKVLGCRVLAYSRNTAVGSFDSNAEFVSFDEILEVSDIISLHTPLTTETKGMISEKEFNKMKSTAILINASRGPVVNSGALAHALNSGQIAATGIDVFDKEPPLDDNEILFSAKNTLLAPHIGFATKESMVKRAKIVFENVGKWLEGNPQNVQF